MAPYLQFDPLHLKTLRPDQTRAIVAIRQAVKEGHRHILVQAPTAFGKTVLASHMIGGSLAKGKHPMFTCPRLTLVEQTIDRFRAEGIQDLGVIQGHHELTNPYAQVQIASIDTLLRREFPDVDYLIVDEAHMQRKAFSKWLKAHPDMLIIGLTATPWRKGMGLIWDKLIIAATLQEMIDKGRACPFLFYVPAPGHEADFSKLKEKDGEFTDESSTKVMTEEHVVGDVIKTWIEKGPGSHTFLFAPTRAAAQVYQKDFIEAGVSCGYIDAFTDKDERKTIFEKFRTAEYKIIASVGCLTTGVDEDVWCIIVATPTKSECNWVQMIGRGERIGIDGKVLIVFDHAGNSLRLGLPTDIVHDHLDMHDPNEKGKTAFDGEKTPIKPKRCHRCNALIPPGKRFCPKCGFALPPAPTHIDSVPGELVVYGSKPKAKEKKPDTQIKQEWLDGLDWYRQKKNFKPGWTANQYKARFGVWPAHGMEPHPKYPALEVRNWHRQRMDEWFEAKRAEEKAHANG